MSTDNDCQFENTVEALLCCYKRMGEGLSESEENAKRKLVRLCKQVIEEFGESK